MQPARNKLVIIAILVAATVYELWHTFSGAPWPGYVAAANGADFVLIPVWVAAIYGLLTARPWQWMAVLLAVTGLILHGAVLRLGEADSGYFFFAAGLIAFFIAMRSVLEDFRVHRERSDQVEGQAQPSIRRAS